MDGSLIGRARDKNTRSDFPLPNNPVKLYNDAPCVPLRDIRHGVYLVPGRGQCPKRRTLQMVFRPIKRLLFPCGGKYGTTKRCLLYRTDSSHNNGDAGGTWFPRLVEQQIKAARTQHCRDSFDYRCGGAGCIRLISRQ